MFQITMRDARIKSGYTIEKAAKQCEISSDILDKYEKDCSEMPITLAVKISRLYHISLDFIFIGPESNYPK